MNDGADSAAMRRGNLRGGGHEAELAGLLRSALTGDQKAYTAFLAGAARLVRAFVRRRVGKCGPHPEDIVQETLLAVHLKRCTWDSNRPVTPWLYAIARYKLIDALRRGRRIHLDLAEIVDTVAAPERQLPGGRAIEKALATLAPGQRSVVSTISVGGRSIGETAASLGMSEIAVRVALHRGLAAIAKRCGRDSGAAEPQRQQAWIAPTNKGEHQRD
jgi:RNA polymerase sigma-70 factor, ECF subfamily